MKHKVLLRCSSYRVKLIAYESMPFNSAVTCMATTSCRDTRKMNLPPFSVLPGLAPRTTWEIILEGGVGRRVSWMRVSDYGMEARCLGIAMKV